MIVLLSQEDATVVKCKLNTGVVNVNDLLLLFTCCLVTTSSNTTVRFQSV